MNKIEPLTLIDGIYTYQEADEILMNFFNSKINFNKIKNLSSHVQLAKEDELAKKRIQELNKNIETLKDIIEHAKSSNKRLVITSKVNIEITESK